MKVRMPRLLGVLNDRDKALFSQRFAKVHVASAVPGSISCACQIHKIKIQAGRSEPREGLSGLTSAIELVKGIYHDRSA